jgi:cbb3-type cytochrome oxidase subunit 1
LRQHKLENPKRVYDDPTETKQKGFTQSNMPTLTRWMIKTALVYLLLGLLVGVLQGVGAALQNGPPVLRQLEPVRIHLFVVGWLTLLIFGVVFWMFPKYNREKLRGHEWLGWAAYWLLNAGLVLRVIGESVAQPGTAFGSLLVASAALQWLAGLAFLYNTWPRIKEK